MNAGGLVVGLLCLGPVVCLVALMVGVELERAAGYGMLTYLVLVTGACVVLPIVAQR